MDFAFDVHTDIGLRCVGAKVNSRIVTLDYELKNGEFVEILTSRHASPSQDWLNFVKTSKAKNKIRSWLKEERREENVLRGKEALEREIKKANLEPKEILIEEKLVEIAKRYGVASAEDLLASVGFGRVSPQQILQKIIGREVEEKSIPKVAKKRSRDTKGVVIKGIDN